MPLARDSSGSLGVKVNGGGGGGGNNIYLDVEVINNGEPAEATATASEQPDGRILLTMMMSSVADNIAGGGSIKKAIASRFSLKG